MHMLFECQESKQIWQAYPLRLEAAVGTCTSFKEYISFLTKVYSDERWWALFWIFLWGIWLKRNVWCFEKKKVQMEDIINRTVNIVGEFEKACCRALRSGIMAKLVEKWAAPNYGIYKLNSDVAFFEDNMMGFGMAIRDYVGDIMMSARERVQGVD